MDKFKKYRPIKFLGQNFLVDDNIAKKIVNSATIDSTDLIIEIGPGYGALTKHIIQKTTNYLGIEIDQKCIDFINEKIGNNVKLIKKDFLEFDFLNEIKKYSLKYNRIKVIGNIPYNITSEILFKLFYNKSLLHSTILMTQKEVAQRLNAKPRTKHYGILSVHTQLNADFKFLFNLSPSVFFPKPKVNSSVFILTFHNKYKINDYENFSKFLKSTFGKRRKTLNNALKDFFPELSYKLIYYDFSRRAEELSPLELLKLYRILSRVK